MSLANRPTLTYRPASLRRGGAAILAAGVLGAGACGGEELPPEIAAGRDLYAVNCAMCHGDGARGDGPMAAGLPVPPPSILEHLGHHTGSQLLGLIRNGVPPAMPPAPLSEEEVRLVIGYVWTLVPDSEAASLRAMRDQMEAAERATAPDTAHAEHTPPPSAGSPAR